MSKKAFRNLIVISIIFVVASFCFYGVATALAAANTDINAGLDTVAGGAGLVKSDLKVTIGKIIKVILGFLGIIAICLVLYGGFLYMTSGGEPAKVTKAKQYLINAGIGLAIILLSYAIVAFVLNQIQGALGDANYNYACQDGKDNDNDGLVDWPADPGCSSATYYSEYAGYNITGEGYLRVLSIVPQGQQKIINVHPRISFNQAVKESTVSLANIVIAASFDTVDQIFPIKPSLVTESNGNGAQILAQIKEKDHTFNSDWVVCSPPEWGNTPMVVEYDVSSLTQQKSAKLNFNNKNAGPNALMNVSCSKDGSTYRLLSNKALFQNGENEITIDSTCLGGTKVYIKWARTGSNCLKFEYMWLNVTSAVPSSVTGTFKLKNGGRLVEFVPDGVCSPDDPSTYSLKADTEYTVTLNSGLMSADGDALLCGVSNPCTAKFTTGDICDVTPPTVNFNTLNKSICQFPVAAPDDYAVSFTAEDDAGVSIVSLNIDEAVEAVGEISPIETPTPTIFTSFIPWSVNDFTLGEHQLQLTVDDVDGNTGTKKAKVFLRPDSCCDAEGNIICGDPACGICDDGPCETDADCANGYCEKEEGATTGVCVPFPLINNINPKEGIDGNFVTIYGSGFSDYVAGISKVWFSAGTETDQKYTLEAELGCKPSDAWSANQIIVKVPIGMDTGPLKVINKKSKEDDTEDADGFVGDFVRNPMLRYPGLCSMEPNLGVAGTIVALHGEKFGDGKTANDNVYFGTSVAVITGSGTWLDTDITGVRVPQINKGIYNVVVAKGERCQKIKEDCAEGSESCLEDCVKGSADCNCYNVVSNPLSFTLNNPDSLPTITDVSPKTCTTGGTICEEGTDGCVCIDAAPITTCTKTTQTTCSEGDDDCVCVAADPIQTCENEGVACTEGDEGCVCTETTPDPECNKAVVSTCTAGTADCVCTTTETKTCTKDATLCDEGADNCVCSGDAPVNQMITITGTSFGSNQGQVIFTPLQVTATGFAEAVDGQGNLVPSFIGVLACGPDSWSDSQVIVRVPESKTVGGATYPMTPGNYWVKVLTYQSLPSNNKHFIVNTNAPGPGICKISPNNGPANTTVTVTGENFGTKETRDLSFVKDIKNLTSRALVDKTGTIAWTTSSITSAKVPADAITGGVKIHSADQTINSNSVDFRVGVCTENSCAANEFCCGDGVCTPGGVGSTKESVCAAQIISYESEYAWVMSTGIIPKIPAVIERTCQIVDVPDYPGYMQSPSPVRDDKLACPNGMISATFNMEINEATLNNNVVVRRCTGADQTVVCDFSNPAEYAVKTLGTLHNEDVGLQPASIVCTDADAAICSAGDVGCICRPSDEELTAFSLESSWSDADTNVIVPYVVGAVTQHHLFPNSWYQVEIVGGVDGVAAPALPGLTAQVMPESYIYTFKTRATNCQPDKFLMFPLTGTTIESVQEAKAYRVTGMSGCQAISVSDKPWDWSIIPDDPETGVVPDIEKAQSKGFGCTVLPLIGANPFCNAAAGSRDVGVYAVHSGAVTTEGGCNQFAPDCESNVIKEVETTPDDLITIQANAVVPEQTVSYEKKGSLAIDFSKPRVTSFYPNCKEACINAQLGAKFSTKMKETTVEDPANIKIYSCETEECTVVTPFDASGASLEYTYNPKTPSFAGDNILRISLLANKNLTPNKYYRVVLSSGMESISGVKLVSLNYHDANIAGQGPNSFSWVFKTKNDPNQCVIDTVNVVPANYVASQPGESVKYSVEPKSAPDKCSADGQILNPLNYNWSWSSPDDANGGNNDGIPLAVVTQNVYNLSVTTKCTDKCLLKGSITYRAVCGDGAVTAGEECEMVGADVKMLVGGVLSTVTGVTCNSTSCLLNSFSACQPSELTNASANCCGNGVVNGKEECDFGAEYLNKNGAACDPATAVATDLCALVSKSAACSAGCLNTGTATGYICGNGVKEAGEDADDGNKTGGDGIGATCLNEGAQTVYSAGLSICGNHSVEEGEKCDPLESDPVANKALCNNKCLVTGYPLCGDPAVAPCCGNGEIETVPGLGTEDCEKTSCFKEEACPTMQDNMAKCTASPAVPGCSIVNGSCVCMESNTCGANGKIKVPCDKGSSADCVCEFPEGCSTKCTNLGSDIKYGAQCGNGSPELGEDAACESGSEGSSGSPYQKATINTEKNSFNNSVYQVILRLLADPAPKKTYSLAKTVVASTNETINNVPQPRTGQTGIKLTVSDAVYNAAVAATCNEPVALAATTIPANNAINVCRNAALFLSTALTEIKSEELCYCRAQVAQPDMTKCEGATKENSCNKNGATCYCDGENVMQPDLTACEGATKLPNCSKQNANNFLFFYKSNVECPAGKDVGNPYALLASTNHSSVNWFVGAYNKVVEFVRSLMFKIGIAAPPYYCKAPDLKGEIKATTDGTEMRGVPSQLLEPNTEYGLKISNFKNKCNDTITPNPYLIKFTTGSEVCRLDNVVVSPADLFVMQSNQSFDYSAYPKSGVQDIFQVPGVYSWVWGWQSTDSALAQVTSTDADNAVIGIQTKNGEAQIKATATITTDALGQVCTPANCTIGTPACSCVQTGSGTTGQQFVGTGNIKAFICDNPWFGDVYNSYNRTIPLEYQYNSSEAITHKKFDLKLEYATQGQLKPSYLVEKEFNAGLFYCRDFGKQGDLTDDLPLVGLQTGAFTEVNPTPRFGAYFDRNFDYVKSNEGFDFMNSTGAPNGTSQEWTISSWVYNDDLPSDRYVRLFYKNLSTDINTVPNQDYVQLGVRSWCIGATPACWDEVMNGTKQLPACGCTAAEVKRSVVFKIKYGTTVIQKGVQGYGMLNNGFNQILLNYDKGDVQLFVNGLELQQCIPNACTPLDNGCTCTLQNETAPLFIWPRGETCAGCATEKDSAGADFDKLFIGGLGKTKVPLVSFGGYVDDFRIFSKALTPEEIKTDPESDLAGAWDFNANPADGSSSVNGTPYCTPDYSTSCLPVGCTLPGTVANPCVCSAASQCLGGNKFKSINITNVAKEKGFFYGDNSGWQELNVGTENQCNDGLDNDNNGLVDVLDPKCTSVTDGWEEPALFAQYFFVRKDDADYPTTNDSSSDAISLRIYENPEALPPSLWYARYVPNPAVSVPIINSDCLKDDSGEFCYAGVQDGRTLYVSASNINGNNVYNNIYLLSYSQNANPATQNIFGQIVQFLKFNMNKLNDGSISKIKVIRDTQRLQDYVLMQEYLSVYKSQHESHVPQLESGTLKRHVSYGVWDSWSQAFPQELGQALPQDPINRLATTPPSYRCELNGFGCTEGDPNCVCDANKSVLCGNDLYGTEKACLSTQQCVVPGVACVICDSAYDSKACYNSSTQTFANIYSNDNNYTYSYEANAADLSQYRFKVNFEVKTAEPATPASLTYKYVPEYVSVAGGWDSIKVDPLVTPVAIGDKKQCSDGLDNDQNGKIDYPNDQGCTSADDDSEEGIYACGNGHDDDDDGQCDFNGCTCNAGNQYCGTGKAYLNGTVMPQDKSCVAVFDNDELHPTQCNDGIDNDGDTFIDAADQHCINEHDNSEKGLPKGNVLFAFFVDNSQSMVSNDQYFTHVEIMKKIVTGIHTAGTPEIDGIADVKGNQAHFLLVASYDLCTLNGNFYCTNAEKDLAVVDDTFPFKYEIGSNKKDGTTSINGFISFLDTAPHPYSYISHADMPPRIMKFVRKTISLYDSENANGDGFNYSGLVFVVITDATDSDTLTTYRQAAVDLANGKQAPIHMLYIGNTETRACSNNSDDDGDGNIDLADPNCDHPLNSSETQAASYSTTDYTYYMRHQDPAISGVYERGNVAQLETLLPKIIGAIASVPVAVPDNSDAY